MNRVTSVHRLLDEVPPLKRSQRAFRRARYAGEASQRLEINVVALDVRENREHSPGLGSELRPRPVDQEPDLGQIVFVGDHANACHPLCLKELRELADRGGPRAHDGVREIERKWIPPQHARERCDPGNAVRPEVTRGAVTGKIKTPASKQRRAVMTKVAPVPESSSRSLAMAASSS